ncbi:cytochrome P450 [Streptomyces cinerochromogenes]|uniref:cytochrome P450 n=1 Tax=Streptomyces cinerochromogenes TaxID=66422 RepID=UPI0016707786|nr:cytochrome P450 [Streptomyces cinerochromogenes]GGS88508.1 biflaviolin synthase CYP158A2 [Streptomyces cinerochromogenes]
MPLDPAPTTPSASTTPSSAAAPAPPSPASAPAPPVRFWPVEDLPALDPDPLLDELLREEPVARIRLPYGSGHAWLVTRYEDVRFVTSDPRFSREQVVGRDVTAMRPVPVASRTAGLQYIDPPRHTRLRRVVARAFTGRSMRRLRPIAERRAAELLDGMERAGAPADLMEHLHGPFPIALIRDLLGVDEKDWHRWAETGEALLSAGADSEERAREAARTTRARITELLRQRRTGPRDDLAGVLAQAAAAGETTDDEAVSLAIAVQVSGGHAVRNNSGSMMYALLTHPAQLDRLRREPELLPQAVEELFRYVPHRNGVGIPRIATEDVEVGGRLIRAGDVVYNAYLAANRDPEVFPDPDALDFDRQGAAHVAFGHGPHHCLAAVMARMEAEVVIGSVLARFPGIRLAVPPERVEFQRQGLIRGPRTLPVTW